MYDFDYVRPASLADAVARMAASPDARLMSGGMTLIPTLKQRLAQPSHVIHVGVLDELRGICRDGDALAIGAATSHETVADSAEVAAAIPALARLAGGIGDPQVRHMGTLGGSIANDDPAADYPAAVLGLGATVLTDRRHIGADEFFRGLFDTALEEGEIIRGVRFPIPLAAGYAKFPHPATGYAMAGVFVARSVGGVRVAVTGGGTGVFRWTQAERALAADPSRASLGDVELDAERFSADIHASRDYRAHLARVMAERALAAMDTGAKAD